MRDTIQAVEGGEIIGWGVVDEAAILRTHKDVSREVAIGGGAVNEGGARLCAGGREILGVEHEGAHARDREGRTAGVTLITAELKHALTGAQALFRCGVSCSAS